MKDAGNFWARRRAAVRAEEEAELRLAEAERARARAAELEARNDAEVLAEMGLPDPASMTAGDDFAAFLSREVPEHLRRQALRTLWRSNPVLACVDGLNDYDEDFRTAAHLNQHAKTAYQVGKGMLSHIEEMARQARVAEGTGDEAAAPCEPADGADCTAMVDDEADSIVMVDAAQAAPGQAADTEEPGVLLRRMKFRFEEETA